MFSICICNSAAIVVNMVNSWRQTYHISLITIYSVNKPLRLLPPTTSTLPRCGRLVGSYKFIKQTWMRRSKRRSVYRWNSRVQADGWWYETVVDRFEYLRNIFNWNEFYKLLVGVRKVSYVSYDQPVSGNAASKTKEQLAFRKERRVEGHEPSTAIMKFIHLIGTECSFLWQSKPCKNTPASICRGNDISAELYSKVALYIKYRIAVLLFIIASLCSNVFNWPYKSKHDGDICHFHILNRD